MTKQNTVACGGRVVWTMWCVVSWRHHAHDTLLVANRFGGSTYHGAFVRLPIGCVCLCGHSLGKDCLCPTLFPNCFHWGHTRARVPTQQTKLVKKQGRLVYLHDSTEGYRGVSERFCTSHAQAGSIDDNRSRERVRDLFFFFSLSSLLLSSLLFWKVPQNELGKVPQTN